MTRIDFIRAGDRYLERLARCNARPSHVIQVRAILNDFLREITLDMEHHPELFEHPDWANPEK